MKAIRVSLYVVAGLLVLLVLGVAIFLATFDPNKYKGQIEQLVKEKTGRTLHLAGDLQVAVWPSLGANVNGVTLSERAPDQQFVALDSAHASVAVLPLLHGNVVVDGIRVSGLKANIVKNKDGSFNFSDLLEPQAGAAKQPEEKKAPEKKAEQRKKEGGQAVAFDIAGVHIDRSGLTYRDLGTGEELAITDLKLDTGRIAEKADGKLGLKAALKGKKPDVDIKVDVSGDYRVDLPAKSFAVSKLDAKANGAAVGVTNLQVGAKGDVAADSAKNEYHVKGLSLEAKGVKEKQSFEAKLSAPQVDVAADQAKGGAVTADAKFKDGTRDIQANLKLSGVEGSAKALAVPQLSADVTMTDPSLPQKTVKLPITGSLRADLEKQTANAELATKFDESTINAKLGLAKFSPMAYVFDINVDRLNLDKYFPPEKKEVSTPQGPTEASGGDAPKPAPQAQKKEEDTPVDLSALKELNANGRLQVGALQVKGVKLANVKAELKAANGRLDLPHSASLYDGAASGAIGAQADGHVAVKENLTGVSIGPLLRDFAQKDTLEGHGNVALDVNGAGKTVNTIKKSLAGNARLQLKDGAIKGINLAEVFRRAKSALGPQDARAQARETQKTDFSELNASFVIKNGVAHNDDLDVKAPLFRVTGKGDIDIGNSTIDYTTRATVVASTKGQGGEDLNQLAGLTVPVHLTGPLDGMKYKVDYSSAAAEFAKSKAGERIKSQIEERLGINKPKEGQSGEQSAPSGQGGSAVDRLKGLIGR